MKTIAFFNNKGGVGKTSLTYHLAWMFAELGIRIVAIDLDPQSNLTSSFLQDEELEELWETSPSPRTISGCIDPLLNRLGDINEPQLVEVDERIRLVPGDLGLSTFEDRLADAWVRCLADNVPDSMDAARVTTAFYRVMERAGAIHDADLVLIDVGPNLGAINRSALISADHVVIPLAADLFSLQGLRNLGPVLRQWRKGWQTRRLKIAEVNEDRLSISLPSGAMSPAGYVVMQPSIRERYPVKAYRRWIARIPEVYRTEVLGEKGPFEIPEIDPLALAVLKNYRSLAPMAQEARKPMFALKPADGAIGGHVGAVKDCYRSIRGIAERLLESCETPLHAAKREVEIG
jgi:cellulose biosynthesis protein BcsQ